MTVFGILLFIIIVGYSTVHNRVRRRRAYEELEDQRKRNAKALNHLRQITPQGI